MTKPASYTAAEALANPAETQRRVQEEHDRRAAKVRAEQRAREKEAERRKAARPASAPQQMMGGFVGAAARGEPVHFDTGGLLEYRRRRGVAYLRLLLDHDYLADRNEHTKAEVERAAAEQALDFKRWLTDPMHERRPVRPKPPLPNPITGNLGYGEEPAPARPPKRDLSDEVGVEPHFSVAGWRGKS